MEHADLRVGAFNINGFNARKLENEGILQTIFKVMI